MKLNFQKIYNSILSWLTSGYRKKLAFIFSHGGLHCVILGILLICAYFMYQAAMKENEIVFKDLDIVWKVNKSIKSLEYDKQLGCEKYDIDFLTIELTPDPLILINDTSISKNSELKEDVTRLNLFRKDVKTNGDIAQSLWTNLRPKDERDSISCMVILYSSKKNQLEKVCATHTGYNIKENIVYYPFTCDYPMNCNAKLANVYSFKNSKIYFRINPKIVDKNDNIIHNLKFSNKGKYSPSIKIIMGSHSIYSVSDKNKLSGEELRDPFMFNIISPTPDEIAQGKFIAFTDSVKLNQIFNNGIVVTAEEISQVDLSQKRMILFNVLIGTILAFCLEIIVQLVIKWRNLVIKTEKTK